MGESTFYIIVVVAVAIVVAIAIILHTFYRARFNRFKEEYKIEQEIIEKKERQKALWDSEVLRSQMEPHFIYNVLNTIKYLCKHDPNEAGIAVDRFSSFLRESMEAFNLPECIPFEEEMDIVDNYIFLEKKRFGDKVEVLFDLQSKNFEVPALSVQPMVENAIKHGITKKLGGGTLWVKSYENKDEYLVEISDNGVGFNVDSVNEDGKVHVGLENTDNRLKLMCGGKLTVESEFNVKTLVTLHIPKESSDE